jgi:HAMP domain-containing protein
VAALMTLNQASMYDEASILKERSHRAIMPGIVAIVAVIVFAFLFNFFLARALVDPLERLISTAKNFRVNLPSFNSNIKSNDEFKDLETAIQDLIIKMKRFYEKPDQDK